MKARHCPAFFPEAATTISLELWQEADHTPIRQKAFEIPLMAGADTGRTMTHLREHW
jgi:hypothetical protein